MSLLAAAVPVAVLVLAWDEATPAVRALVEATETPAPVLDSVVVLVPAETGEFTQEEFLPLVAEPTPLLAVAGEEPIQAEETDNEEAEAAPQSRPAALPSPPLAVLAPAVLPALAAPPATLPIKLATTAIAAPGPPTWSAVRVLHLSSFSLSELAELSSQALPRPIWQHSSLLPVAPYLGSQVEVIKRETRLLAAPTRTQPSAAAALPAPPMRSALLLSPALPTIAHPEQPLPALPSAAPSYLTTEPPLPARDAEADLAPVQPAEQAAETLPPEAPLAEATGTAQAGWSEALASLRDPLPAEEPAPSTDLEDEAAYYAATAGEQPASAGAGPAELRPTAQPFEAPNLNFQVIQYARFAVPVALAQAPFAVIYAPAWPTWLAAQELRYRTRQPLVLHVSTLAAGDDDSLESATGWQAELQRQALHRADLILAETPELAHRLRHDLGLLPELVRTVLAADADAVAQALRTAQVRPSVSPS